MPELTANIGLKLGLGVARGLRLPYQKMADDGIEETSDARISQRHYERRFIVESLRPVKTNCLAALAGH